MSIQLNVWSDPPGDWRKQVLRYEVQLQGKRTGADDGWRMLDVDAHTGKIVQSMAHG